MPVSFLAILFTKSLSGVLSKDCALFFNLYTNLKKRFRMLDFIGILTFLYGDFIGD
jgi:hypothetical protein